MEALEKEGLTGRVAMTKAGYEAREATLDFYRHGSVGASLNKICAFWNANMQGVDKMVRTFKDQPITASMKAIMGVTMPSVTLTAAQWDNPVYREIPQWQRDLFWCIALGTDPKTATIIRIPKPFEYGLLFGSLPERVAQWILDRDPHAFDRMLQTFSRSFNPAPIPTILNAAMETYFNYSTFTDRPLMSESTASLLPGYQSTPYGTKITKDIGEAVGFSPARAEHLLRGTTGGLGMHALKALDMVYKQVNPPSVPGMDWQTSDIPGIGGLVMRFPTTDVQSIARFYNTLDEARKVQRTINELREGGRRADSDRMVQEAREKFGITGSITAPGQYSLGFLQDYQNRMQDRWKKIERVRNDPSMPPTVKSQQVNEIIVDMMRIAGDANQKVDNRTGHDSKSHTSGD